MRTNKTTAWSMVIAVGFIAVTGMVWAQSHGERADCAGKITCPLTGEQIARDKCPTVDPNRADCPGRVICPLTGELVCKDLCPLVKKGAAPAAVKTDLPPCCAKKGQEPIAGVDTGAELPRMQ